MLLLLLLVVVVAPWRRLSPATRPSAQARQAPQQVAELLGVEGRQLPVRRLGQCVHKCRHNLLLPSCC
jgi:hypothetical protein